MPVKYQFVDRITNQPVNLCQIDKELCEATGTCESESHYSPFFDALTTLGIALTTSGYFDADKFNNMFGNNKSENELKMVGIIKQFLNGRYVFKSWR